MFEVYHTDLLQVVTVEEMAVFFAALILGFFTGRRDSDDINHQSHLASFWVGFEHGYQARIEEEKDMVEGVDNSPEL